MTLNADTHSCCRKDASFGAHHKNFNEHRPIVSATKILANVSSFSLYKVYADIREGSLGMGVKRQYRVVDNDNF